MSARHRHAKALEGHRRELADSAASCLAHNLAVDRVAQDLAAYSRPFAEGARAEFRAVKAEQLKAVQLERRTRRQALDTMQRKFAKLRAAYLRITGTTYQTWIDAGPHEEWKEVLEAVKDEAVWDRLVERGVVGRER